jgi:MHS family proline/betaine transporter-like MFS transporter
LAFNVFFVFMPNHVAARGDVPLQSALGIAAGGLLVAGLTALVCGRASDRVGRRPVVATATALLAGLALPLAVVADRGSLLGLAAAELGIGLAIGGVLSMATVAEMFPSAVRATGMSLTVGLGSALLGGTAPLLAQLLVGATGVAGVGLYVAAVALVAVVGLLRWPETAFAPLPERP